MLCGLKFGTFFLFAGFVLIMTLFVIFCVPETKGVPIEELNEVIMQKVRGSGGGGGFGGGFWGRGLRSACWGTSLRFLGEFVVWVEGPWAVVNPCSSASRHSQSKGTNLCTLATSPLNPPPPPSLHNTALALEPHREGR